jgi:NAD(P)-dependent dehydrogenase (short-subunit alcohol dehydrogenase family)
VLLIGGTSAIGSALVEEIVDGDSQVSVTVRDPASFTFKTRAQHGQVLQLDLVDSESITRGVQHAFTHGGFDLVVLAAGMLGPSQSTINKDPVCGDELVATNLCGTTQLIDELIEALSRHGGGKIVFISSIAAVRIRPANALYGQTKRSVERHLDAQRSAAKARGVELCVLRLGFVHTPMTAGLQPRILSRSAKEVAKETAVMLTSGRDVIWVPRALRWVALVLRVLPAFVLRRIAS